MYRWVVIIEGEWAVLEVNLGRLIVTIATQFFPNYFVFL